MVKSPICQCRKRMRCGFSSRVGNIPWRRKLLTTPVFLPASLLGRKESDTGKYSPPPTFLHHPPHSYFDSFLLLAWTLYTWVILLHSLLNGWFSSMNDCHTKSVQGSEMMIEPPSCHSGGWVRDSSLNSAFIFPQLKHFSCLVSLVFSFQHSTLTVTNNMRNSSPWHYSWIWKNLIKKSNHTHSLSRNTSALFWNFGNFSLHFSA